MRIEMGRLRKQINIVLLLFLLFSASARAEEVRSPKAAAGSKSEAAPKAPKSAGASGAPKSSNILDFDADVIEGERSGPSIMIQMDLQAPNLDTLVFQRKNFNDFHALDMKRKPKYRDKK